MFDIGAAELLVIAIVAILVIGPKDMPLALRPAGRWIGQVRRVSSHFRSGIDAMVREAEIEEMEKKWKERNAQIMRDHPGEMTPLPPEPQHPTGDDPAPEAKSAADPASAEARAAQTASTEDSETSAEEPMLPLDGADKDASKSAGKGN